MSMYAHRCENCGHRSYEHNDTGCRLLTGCRCPAPQFGPSELVPTFDKDGEQAFIHAPGDGPHAQARLAANEPDPKTGRWAYATPGAPIVKSCDCDECKQAYAAVSA